MGLLKGDLRELELFSEASRSELRVIGRQLTRLKVEAGRVLVREGGIGNEFMIMVSGTAEVTQGGHHIATLGAGDLIGEMALLQPMGSGRRNATVTALTDCEIYAGSPSEFRHIMEAAPSVAAKVRQTIAARTAATPRTLVAA
ncbi:MAG: cyclic nucleotide-binding domain-containing protein [Acidimicrobiales bacterium]